MIFLSFARPSYQNANYTKVPIIIVIPIRDIEIKKLAPRAILLYTDKISIAVQEENAREEVNLFDVAYWPPGQAICLFYGPTPISKPNRILAYSPVSVVGRIIPYLDEKCKVLEKIHDKTMVFIKKIN